MFTDLHVRLTAYFLFRHTGIMETFHSLSLGYAWKRNDYDYDILVIRKSLAVIDHNHHMLLPLKINAATGKPVCSNKWTKAMKAYTPTFMRVRKCAY